MPGSGVTIPLIDLIIIVVYLTGILAIGIISSRKQRGTSSDYFLAGRSLKWVMVGSALFATNISTIHLVGLASDGYRIGLVIGNFEWMASFCLIILGLIFAPFYFKSKITTLPEYLEKRYSSGSRTALAFISVLSALLIHIGISLYAGAKVFELFFNIDVIYSIIIIAVITAVYTVLGGLKAVVVTETVQTFVLLLGAVSITLAAIFALPDIGIDSLQEFRSAVKPDQLSLIHPIHNDRGLMNEFSWLSVLLGYPILGIWYWCADQTIVQRVLGAKNQFHAQHGPIFAGFLKILPVFIMVFPGVVGYVLFEDIIGTDYNSTLPVMIEQLLPSGLKGIVAAGLLAALMSTISGALNSSATLVAVDIVKRIKPATKDKTQIFIGRMSAVVVMILAMLWSTQGGKFESIFVAINKIPMIFAPAITCVFIWGVFCRRGTKEASLTTLIVGFIAGSIYFVIDLPFRPLVGNERIVTDLWGIPFMQVGWWLFCFCSVVYAAVSFTTPRPAQDKIENLCWGNPFKVLISEKFSGIKDPRSFASLLFIIMILFYYFLR